MLCACVLVAGCGRKGGPQDLENVVQPDGKVLLANGQPAKGAKVEFAPTAVDGVAAHGVVKSDGTFSFVTRGGQAGIVPGVYKVTVVPSPDEATPPEDAAFARANLPPPAEQEVTVGTAAVVIRLRSTAP